MNLTFEHISLSNFKAIGEATVKLNNRGIVMVKGVNTYEATASSNGSGKTSIFSGLFWALYGKTPEGISNPSNRYNKGVCQVELGFSVDSNAYIVKRFVKGSSQGVELTVNGENRSGRNRTDTDKIIKDEILQMSSDIFLSLVYLSQGFGSRLSLLTPTLRKDRLEQLTDTAKRIAEFSESVSNLESSTISQINVLRSNHSKSIGSQETYTRLMNELTAKIEELATQRTFVEISGKRYDSSCIPQLNANLNEITAEHSRLITNLQPVRGLLTHQESELRQINLEMRNSQVKLDSVADKLNSVNQEALCPTCGQVLDAEKKEILASQYEKEKIQLEETLQKLSCSEASCKEAIAKLTADINNAQLEIDAVETKRNHIQYILSQIPQVQSADPAPLQSKVKEHQQQIEELSLQLASLEADIVKLEGKKAVMSHCRQLITKQFRAYLLTSAVDYLNTKLKSYSTALFSNKADCVMLSADSQKLDITLGEAEYETLSGGEQRRVDLIMMLAQRDLALEVAGISCNVLIMDEIMESMDETATQSALGLLESQSHNVDSMFIISHNDYSLPIDSIITVTKGENRVATVSST